jgi:chorismate mutase
MRIEDWRAKIDAIDDELVVLLNMRSSLVAETVAQKQREGLPLRDSKREQEILLRARQSNVGPMDHDAIDEIFRLIISESRRVAMETATASTMAATNRL